MSKDYYAILGVSKSASESEIKKAYRDLSKKWHPDKHKGEKEAEQKFKEINEAYEVLGNSKRRAQYDQFGSSGGPNMGGGFGGFDFSGFQQGDLGGFGDIFESFFGGSASGTRGGARTRDQRGGDLQVRITVEFADIVEGGKKTIAIEKYVSCSTCSGSGSEGGKSISCSECGGTGQIVRTAQSFFGTIQQAVQCPRCHGAGTVPESPCATCNGEGRVRQKTDISVAIPAGIHDGQTLKISGQGDAGRQGAPAGDLYIIVQVRPDPRFSRKENDIYSTISLPVVDAILGIDVGVETVHGRVTLSIPAGTQPKQILRIKGKGLPQVGSSRMGDHYVTVDIEIPKKLSRKERKLIEEWKSIS